MVLWAGLQSFQAFGLSLMIAVFRQDHPQLPQSGPRVQKTHANAETRPKTLRLYIPVALV